MSGTESRLLNFGKVVLWIAVQNDTSDVDQRKLAVRPDLQNITETHKLNHSIQIKLSTQLKWN